MKHIPLVLAMLLLAGYAAAEGLGYSPYGLFDSYISGGGKAAGSLDLDDNPLYMDQTNDADTYLEQNTTSDTMRLAIGGAYIDITESTADDVDFNSFAFKEVSYTVPTTNNCSSNAVTVDLANGVAQAIDFNEDGAGDCVLTLSNPRTGGSYFFKIIQDSNLDDITWPAAVKFPGGVAPTITDTDDAVDVVSCFYDGTIYMCTFAQDLQ